MWSCVDVLAAQDSIQSSSNTGNTNMYAMKIENLLEPTEKEKK